MSPSLKFFYSSIGKKVMMALTGLGLFGFVVAHLLGNLKIFQGQDSFNSYAAFLASIPGPLWLARIGLLAIAVLHVVTAFWLNTENLKARPQGYRRMDTVTASPSSRYMIHSGMIILIFILVHLAHYSFGWLQPEHYHLIDPKGRRDVYYMVVAGFSSPYYSVFYIVAMLAIGFHLSHGLNSLVQTLGLNHPRYSPFIKKLAISLAALIALGYSSIPAAALLGILSLPVAG